MATAPLSTKKMPLPVEIFCAAMERQVPLADYARNIDIHPDILHDVLTGRLNGADPHSVNSLAKAINRDPEQIDLTTAPFHESFGTWLKRNMEGITQHALRARAQLDTQTLKRFLNGNVLPDSDQAERISRALYIDRMEIARVVTANMAAASPSIPSQEPPKPKATGRQSTVRHAETPATVSTEPGTSDTAGQAVAGTQRRRASTRHASAEPASLPSAVATTTIDETASATAEPDTAATGDSPTAGKRARRTSTRRAQVPTAAVAPMATHRSGEEFSPIPAVEAHEPDRDDGSVPTAAAPLADEGLQPTTESMMAPLVTAELAADTTTFQLSPDEVRLIRHWRQLHPHGRRATLHYIGSLLVDA